MREISSRDVGATVASALAKEDLSRVQSLLVASPPPPVDSTVNAEQLEAQDDETREKLNEAGTIAVSAANSLAAAFSASNETLKKDDAVTTIIVNVLNQIVVASTSLTTDEDTGVSAATVEANEQAQNQAADDVGNTLGSLSVAFNANAEAEVAVAVEATTFTAVFIKKVVDPRAAPVNLAAEVAIVFAPQQVIADVLKSTTNATDAVSTNAATTLLDAIASSGTGSGSGFLLPPNMSALQGRSTVDTTSVFYPVSLRPARRADATNGTTQAFASGVTAIELRDGEEVIKVENLRTPILFASKVTLPPGIDRNTSCGHEADACNATFNELSAAADAKTAECDELAAGARVSSRGQAKLNRCKAQMQKAERARDEQGDKCNAMPAPCYGHGICLRPDHVCQCEMNWGGPQCDMDTSFTCSFYNTTSGYWSSNGCEPRYLKFMNQTSGRVLCACNHLTDFATMVAILQAPTCA